MIALWRRDWTWCVGAGLLRFPISQQRILKHAEPEDPDAQRDEGWPLLDPVGGGVYSPPRDLNR